MNIENHAFYMIVLKRVLMQNETCHERMCLSQMSSGIEI